MLLATRLAGEGRKKQPKSNCSLLPWVSQVTKARTRGTSSLLTPLGSFLFTTKVPPSTADVTIPLPLPLVVRLASLKGERREAMVVDLMAVVKSVSKIRRREAAADRSESESQEREI